MRYHKVLGVIDGKGNPLILANLRDLAAIAAMQGLLTNSLPGTNCGVLAIDAVNYADALLAELEKEP
jgi:hypothetical protein